jgi:hypothetical protein
MGWVTKEWPCVGVDFADGSDCQRKGCLGMRAIRFLSIDKANGLGRAILLCEPHAAELREKLARKAGVPVTPATSEPELMPPAAAPELEHCCHARGCRVPVPPRMLMCGRHWRMVPKPIQAKVWQHYRDGQEIDKRPSRSYLHWMEEAIAAVVNREWTKAG